MTESARQDETVVELVDYLRATLRAMDVVIADMQEQRRGFAVKLAAIEAASDPRVLAVADDFERRVGEERPYEGAEDANDVIAEAHRRFVP